MNNRENIDPWYLGLHVHLGVLECSKPNTNRAQILVVSEYHHCYQRMERYLNILDKEDWRSIEKGPHIHVLTPIIVDKTQVRLGGGQVAMTRPTNDDISKMDKDEIAFSKISYGVTPDSFDLIINYKSAKEIWDVLKNLYKGKKQAQEKKSRQLL